MLKVEGERLILFLYSFLSIKESIFNPLKLFTNLEIERNQQYTGFLLQNDRIILNTNLRKYILSTFFILIKAKFSTSID